MVSCCGGFCLAVGFWACCVVSVCVKCGHCLRGLIEWVLVLVFVGTPCRGDVFCCSAPFCFVVLFRRFGCVCVVVCWLLSFVVLCSVVLLC